VLTGLHSVFARLEVQVPFTSEEFMRRLVKWVVCDNQPFIVAENADFREMFALIKPDISFPSATTVKREIIRWYHEEAARLSKRLRGVDSKISLTLDCWTSPNGLAFLCVTAHYIDAQCIPHEPVLGFLPLHGSHTGENLCEALIDVCDQFGILPKILGVTTDNAANINKLLACLEDACQDRGIAFSKKEQHVRCLLHVLNLSVQALLYELRAEVPNYGGPDGPADDAAAATDPDGGAAAVAQASQLSCIAKLRSTIVKIRSSPRRSHEFHIMCDACRVPRKELLLDVRTRWGSTYAMLERACELRAPLSSMARLSSDFHELDDDEWGLVEVSQSPNGCAMGCSS